MYTTQSFLTNGMISLFNPAHKDALLHDFQASVLDYQRFFIINVLLHIFELPCPYILWQKMLPLLHLFFDAKVSAS